MSKKNNNGNAAAVVPVKEPKYNISRELWRDEAHVFQVAGSSLWFVQKNDDEPEEFETKREAVESLNE